MKDTQDPDVLNSLAQGRIPALAAHMEPTRPTLSTVQAAIVLLRFMKDTKDPKSLLWLAQRMSELANRMDS